MVIVGFFDYQPHIAPACIEFIESPSEKYPMDDTMALMAGWGLTKVQGHWASSLTLQTFDIPVMNSSYCQEKAPSHFKGNVIEDKVCNWLLFDFSY